jgi:hypothetical protein
VARWPKWQFACAFGLTLLLISLLAHVSGGWLQGGVGLGQAPLPTNTSSSAAAVLTVTQPSTSVSEGVASGVHLRAVPECDYGSQIRALVNALGAHVVGACLENERTTSASGDTEQRTAAGLLVWRQAQSLAAFTDGATSWYLCRDGLHKRASGEHYQCKPGPGVVLLADSFEDPNIGHLPQSASHPDHYASGYAMGVYKMKTLDTDWALAPAEFIPGTYADASIAIDARVVGESQGRYVALICRNDHESDSQYRLTVVPAEGWLMLTRWDQGKPVHLTGKLTSGPIGRGNETNLLELSCANTAISASVNGSLIALVQDNVYREGGLGISTSSFGDARARAEAHFDNLLVTQR